PSLPYTKAQQKLALIWERLLNVRPIGLSDDFFDLGGDSLLAVRLFAQIDKVFGKRLPVATLKSAPTLEQLAALVENHSLAHVAYVTPIQAKGEACPFFCVGAGPLLWPLSEALGPNQPFF